jgi:outer membrane lipoprotein-sorting protein
MKKIILLLHVILLFFAAFTQNSDNTLPKLVKDTLFTTSSYKIVEGQEIKIGTGSMPDGDFKFIRRNAMSIFSYYSTTTVDANLLTPFGIPFA